MSMIRHEALTASERERKKQRAPLLRFGNCSNSKTLQKMFECLTDRVPVRNMHYNAPASRIKVDFGRVVVRVQFRAEVLVLRSGHFTGKQQ